MGRAIALALAARGVRIVVTGRDEKALGETVGEVVHAGGKARHLAGDPADPAHVQAAFDRAIEVFGGLDIVVASDISGVECMLSAVARRERGPGRMIVAACSGTADEALAKMLRAASTDLAARGVAANAVLTDAALDDGPEHAAELVVFLCSRAGASVSGQVIAVGSHPIRQAITNG